MNVKIFLRPIALPALVVSLAFVFIPPLQFITALGVLFYAGAVYRAFQKERDKALPPGTEDEIDRLPYRRRRLANLAVAAARDIERQLHSLPRDMVERLALAPADAGRLAAAVVFYLKQEAEAAKIGGAESRRLAEEAGKQAEEAYKKIQELQSALVSLALASGRADASAAFAPAARAVEEVKALTRAVEAARAELYGLQAPALVEKELPREDEENTQAGV